MMVSPQINEAIGNFRAVVGKQVLWRPAMASQAVERFHHMFAAQALANLDCQRLAAEHIDHCQHPALLPVAELVVHEVQAPGFVRPLWHRSRLPVYDHFAPARLFCSQNQAFFLVEAINDIAANLPALALQHDVCTPVAMTDPGGDYLMHALAYSRPWIPDARFTLRRAMLPRHLAGPALAVAV